MQNLLDKNQDAYLKTIYGEIRNYLLKKDYKIESVPESLNYINDSGEAYSMAYPIQGILKYHGFAGLPENRIAYFPSISFNNDCAKTISYVKFDKSFKKDKAIINGSLASGESLERVKLALNFIRDQAKLNAKALYVSRNCIKNSNSDEIGKGLGTSAAASASLALAAASIIYDNKKEYIKNNRLMSIFSRYLSGSGCRSSTGGISIWLSHPNASTLDSFALRLDRKEHAKFIDNITLLTIPIQSPIKTTQAHDVAPLSPFFPAWLSYRKKLVLDFIEALDNHDLDAMGRLAEYDTMCLHSITMTAAPDKPLIAWEPDTIKIMHKVRKLRKGGNVVYFTVDTGPSVVLMARNKDVSSIINELSPIISDLSILKGKIGGPSQILPPKSDEARTLTNDIEKVKY